MSRSLVAEVNAWFRARESRRPPGSRILHDPWAHALHPGDLRLQSVRVLRFALPPVRRLIEWLQVAHCVRHAAVDALVSEALDEGFSQVVVLGAGHDMRRDRLAASAPWFEVDHADTLAQKAARLGAYTEARRGVQVLARDLSHPGMAEALGREGFRAERPTAWVLEGVAHYLSRQQLQALLAEIRRASPRARLVASVIRPDMSRRGSRLFQGLWKMTGEIPRTWWDRATLAPFAAERGWTIGGWWDFDDQVRMLVPAARGRTTPYSQDVVQLDVAQEPG